MDDKTEKIRELLIDRFGEDILENHIQEYLTIYLCDYDTAALMAMRDVVLMLLEELD